MDAADEEEEDEEFQFEDAFLGAGDWSRGAVEKQSDLDVELAIFVDEKLWDKFHRTKGADADQSLRNYVTTVLNNVSSALLAVRRR